MSAGAEARDDTLHDGAAGPASSDVRARVAVAVTWAALAAGVTLVAGLGLEALGVSGARAALDVGCGALLVVPLVRNGVVVALDRRPTMRWLALLVAVALVVLDAAALLERNPSPPEPEEEQR